MQDDKALKQLFKSNRQEIRDRGFSKDVKNKLPERINILPQIIIVCFAVIGMGAFVAMQGFTLFFESINDMVTAGNQVENFLTPYFTGMIVLGSVGYAVYQSDNV